MITKLWNKRVVRFVVVGITNTVIDFTILNILVFAFGLNKITANIISVSVAMTISYFLNHKIVFKNKENDHAKKFITFIAVTAFGLYVIQSIVLYLFLHIFTWPAETITSLLNNVGFTNISYSFVALNFAKAWATGATMVWNYFMYKKFVFIDKK